MYDAYEALPILEKLPLLIESIAAYGMFYFDLWRNVLHLLIMHCYALKHTCT